MLTDGANGGDAAGTFASGAETVDLAVAASAAFVAGAATLAAGVVAIYGVPVHDSSQLRYLDSMTSKLNETFANATRTYSYYASYKYKGQRLSTDLGFADWKVAAEEFRRRLLNSRRPLTESGRIRQFQTFLELADTYRNDAQRLRFEILTDLRRRQVDTARSKAADYIAAQTQALNAAYRRIPRLPAGIAPDWHSSATVVPGTGRPRLCVGSAAFAPVSITTLRSEWRDIAEERLTQTQTFPLITAQVPLILDLDRHGGLRTDDPDVVASVALRLLALLPPNRLKISVFDPLRLGESAAALFALDDMAANVIGDKVWTTEQELGDLLSRMEAHLTLVTQKYLQGQHDSLTAYNAQAGEVAEPYQLLLLYDYPAGFRRVDGYYDNEALARLAKIVEMGPRCGVFAFVMSSEQMLAAAPQEQTGIVSGVQTYRPAFIGSLPALYRGQIIDDSTFNRLLGVSSWGTGVDGLCSEPVRDAGGALKRATERSRHPFTVTASGGSWRYVPARPLDAEAVADVSARVQRGFATATDVQVTPERVAELARARLARDVARGTRAPAMLPEPGDPSTWWHGRTDRGAVALFGRSGASDVAVLGLDSENQSNVLLGGRPGAGKSVWLHAVIASLCQQYSPQELSLYLVDFKEGVEFNAYAAGRLPHARVVAVESEREFGLSVLASLDAEITRRGELLRGSDGRQVEIGAYRARTGLPLARIVLIIDEFHVLFERDDKIATAAAEYIERIVRQGRAFGVHTILASQTLAGTSGLGRHIFNLIPVRVALQSSDADSRMLLAEDNADAQLLARPGEGILNTRAGLKDANQRFQTAYWDADERVGLIARLRELADARGFAQAPVVFEGRLPAAVAEIPAGAFRSAAGADGLLLPLGLPLTLDPPVGARLRREPGGNLLLLAPEEVTDNLLTVALTTLAADRVECHVLDFGPQDAGWTRVLEVPPAPDTVVRHRSRAAATALAQLAKLVGERQDAAAYRAATKVMFIVALHRAREFDASAYDDEQNAVLERILREGPDVGVHVIATCDKAVSLERKLSSAALRDFGLRLLTRVDRDTSFRLVDSDAAVNLTAAQAVLDDHDRGESAKLRWFAGADAAWIGSVLSDSAPEAA